MLKPTLQALVLADNVYQDKVTGKIIIAGTFNRLIFTKPAESGSEKQSNAELNIDGQRQMAWHEVHRSGSPSVYISLTNARGSIPLELRYVDLLDNTVLFAVKFTVKFEDPLKTIEAIVPVPPLPTPHAGVYTLELLCGDEPLGAHRIAAVDSSKAPEAEEK